MNIQFYPRELDYVNAKLLEAGEITSSFLHTFLLACLRADAENYEQLRMPLAHFMQKYPAKKEFLAAEHSDT